MKSTFRLRRTLHFDGTAAPVRRLRTALGGFLDQHDVPPEVVRAVVLAFGEALDNAVEHGGAREGEVKVRVRFTPRFVALKIVDPGSDRVPLGVAHEPDPDSERGRGFQLMNKLMDIVHVRCDRAGRTRVSMLRRLGRA